MLIQSNPTPRQLTYAERELLAKFARFEVRPDELMIELEGMLKLEFGSEKRTLTFHFLVSEPGIQIEKHIHRAMEKCRTGGISDDELYRWAIMLLLNDAYVWEGSGEGEIVDALHDLADISSPKVHNRLD